MSSIPSKGVGDALFIPKYNESDMAQTPGRISEGLVQNKQYELLGEFGGKHDSPQYPPTVFGRIGKSAIRAHPYNDPNSQSKRKITFPDDEARNNILKCGAGHQPIYQKDISPFEEYDHRPSSVCVHNAPNIYLTWNERKHKYNGT